MAQSIVTDLRTTATELLKLDYVSEVARIGDALRSALASRLNRRGFVVAMSGGIDSSVCAALCVEAVGKKKVFGLLLPERDSSPNSRSRGEDLAQQLGIDYEIQDIGPTLQAIGCYGRRDSAIRRALPNYSSEWKSKIVLHGGLEGKINHFVIVAEAPDGSMHEKRLRLREYLEIVAATNFKQRVRKSIEYFHADRLNFAVVGTPNLLEFDQGFFVKNGDGSADVKPISHLYKSQVYAIAWHLGLPEDICRAAPTTDTYSLPQGQDEFYFALPYESMDIALWYYNESKSAADLASILEIEEERAEHVYRDIERKRAVARYLHAAPIAAR